jgi:hypothetical protein
MGKTGYHRPPNSCVLSGYDIGDYCYNLGYSAGHDTYPQPYYACVVSSRMNVSQVDSYCYGYTEGQLELVLKDNNSTQPQPQPQSFNGQDFGDLRSIAAGLVNIHTGVLHDEQGGFIPWSVICEKGQQYLVQPCSEIVNSDGSLTQTGDTAVGCIRNGLAAAIAATKVNLPFGLTKGLLNFIAPLSGCGNIVYMSGELQYVLHTAVL